MTIGVVLNRPYSTSVSIGDTTLPVRYGGRFELDDARKILSEHNLDVNLSDSQYAIHINSRGIDKGTGFTELMKKFNILKDDVIAIGDSATDVPLFKVAKTSIALGNASDLVRSEATMTVSASSGDGVLEALDKLAPKFSEI